MLDYDGNPIIRTRPEGVEELSNVNFYDMEGEPFSVEFGQFIEGFMTVKFLCEINGEKKEQFYEISPSGFTFKPPITDSYQRLGLDYRFNNHLSPSDFFHKHVSCFKTKERLDFLYDIANCNLAKAHEEFIQNKQRGPYKGRESIYFTNARNMLKRYFEVLAYIKKQQAKKETKLQEKQNQTEPN